MGHKADQNGIWVKTLNQTYIMCLKTWDVSGYLSFVCSLVLVPASLLSNEMKSQTNTVSGLVILRAVPRPDCVADRGWQGHCWPEGHENVAVAVGKGHRHTTVSIRAATQRGERRHEQEEDTNLVNALPSQSFNLICWRHIFLFICLYSMTCTYLRSKEGVFRST